MYLMLSGYLNCLALGVRMRNWAGEIHKGIEQIRNYPTLVRAARFSCECRNLFSTEGRRVGPVYLSGNGNNCLTSTDVRAGWLRIWVLTHPSLTWFL